MIPTRDASAVARRIRVDDATTALNAVRAALWPTALSPSAAAEEKCRRCRLAPSNFPASRRVIVRIRPACRLLVPRAMLTARPRLPSQRRPNAPVVRAAAALINPKPEPAPLAHANAARLRAGSADEDGHWPMPGKDYENTRFSGPDELTRDNAKNLRLVWTQKTGVQRGHEDQQLAGLIMWVPAGLLLALLSLGLFVAWLGEAGRRVEHAEKRRAVTAERSDTC